MTIAEIAPSIAEPIEFEAQQPLRRGSVRDTVVLRTRTVSSNLVQVSAGDSVVGFLELTGGVWVALCGRVYFWATEVGQNLDPDQAVLSLFAAGVRPVASTGLPRGCGPRKL